MTYPRTTVYGIGVVLSLLAVGFSDTWSIAATLPMLVVGLMLMGFAVSSKFPR